MSELSQKEYLKKYLNIGKIPGEKKKKKKKKSEIQRVRIIDDDEIPAETLTNIVDIENQDEDAPQIVAVIDERPLSMRIDEQTKNPKWIPISSDYTENIEETNTKITFNIAKNLPKTKDERPPQPSATPPRDDTTERSFSPPRRPRAPDDDCSPPRKSTANSDQSPIRRKNNRQSSTRKMSPPKKLSKTLDGKTAGLQNAKQLQKETHSMKMKENEKFAKMSAEISGKNAETIVRNRHTGQKIDLEKEAELKRKKSAKDNELKTKYMRWGRGLTQVEEHEKKLQEELHEMNKPLARYADDADLEKYLKNQERDGDPMLTYLRKKRRKEAVENNIKIKPQFEGEFMPNRYGIRPGHRWDGVDRSNGYEHKWFDVQNAKRAQEEVSYKWSTEDM